MKKAILILTLSLLAIVAIAQEKADYPRTRVGQVLSDWSVKALKSLTIPSGPTPFFPAWIADTSKCGALFYKITSGDTTLCVYNCQSASWDEYVSKKQQAAYVAAALSGYIHTGLSVGGDLTGTLPNPIVNTVNGITKGYYDPTSSIQAQLNSKQATLVSGTIKTVNSTSLLGSGNLAITTANTDTSSAGFATNQKLGTYQTKAQALATFFTLSGNNSISGTNGISGPWTFNTSPILATGNNYRIKSAYASGNDYFIMHNNEGGYTGSPALQIYGAFGNGIQIFGDTLRNSLGGQFALKSDITSALASYPLSSTVVLKANNLSDVSNPATALINLNGVPYYTGSGPLTVKKDHVIYTIGDSITQRGYYQSTLTSDLSNVFTIINLGISGGKTNYMVSRFGEVTNGRGEYVIFWGGVNDIIQGSTAAQIIANIQSVVTSANAYGIPLIVNTISPFGNNVNWTSAFEAIRTTVNTAITGHTITGTYTAIDASTVLQDPSNHQNLNPIWDSGDGLHYNTTGGTVLGNYIYANYSFTASSSTHRVEFAGDLYFDQSLGTFSTPFFQKVNTNTLNVIGVNTAASPAITAVTGTDAQLGMTITANSTTQSAAFFQTLTPSAYPIHSLGANGSYTGNLQADNAVGISVKLNSATSAGNFLSLNNSLGFAVAFITPTGQINTTGGIAMNTALTAAAGGSQYLNDIYPTITGDPGGTTGYTVGIQQSIWGGGNNIANGTNQLFTSNNSMTGGSVAVQTNDQHTFILNGAGNTSTGYNSNYSLSVASTGGITGTFSHININTPTTTGGGTIGTIYGVNIASQKTSLITNAYAFYQSGLSDKNYFGGQSGFGMSSPTALAQFSQSSTGTGTISVTSTVGTVTGTGTTFTTTFAVGQTITANGETRTVAGITNNTLMTTDAWTNTFNGAYTLPSRNVLFVNGNGTLNASQYTTVGGILYSSNSSGLLTQTAQGPANTILHGNGTSGPAFSAVATGDISNNAVTYAKIQAVTTNRLLGSGAGTAVAEITPGTGLSFSGSTLNAVGFANPMTTNQDLIIGGTSGSATRLALGANNSILKVNGSGNIAWIVQLGNVAPTIVSGSTSGTASFNMPDQDTYRKKVIIYCSALNGTASYTFPIAFTYVPQVTTGAAISTTINTTSVTVSGTTQTGFIVLEGY